MEQTFDPARLKGRTLFVGTPMYDGKCFSEYTFAMVRLTALCTQLGIALQLFFACNEALIAKARNETVERFLQSGCDALLFIDGDIGFDPRDVIQLFALQLETTEQDILAAPYPLKRIDWARVRDAAKLGLADADADALAHVASGVRIDPLHGPSFAIDAPVEVSQAGTGFMLIRRETIERFRAAYPDRAYRRETPSTPGAPTPFVFFETEIEGGFYISEDYAFCRRVRAAGMRVWLCPWVVLTHSGSLRFESRLADLGRIGPV